MQMRVKDRLCKSVFNACVQTQTDFKDTSIENHLRLLKASVRFSASEQRAVSEPQAAAGLSLMQIITYCTLVEFALVKANYHLKMSCKGLWARSFCRKLSLRLSLFPVFLVETREKNNGKCCKSCSPILLRRNIKYILCLIEHHISTFSNFMTFKSFAKFAFGNTCLSPR